MSKRNTSPASDPGVSLVEILAVVTILGVLAAVVVLSVRGGADDAEAAAHAADARVLETAQAAFAVSAGRYADESELVEAGHLRQPSDLHDIVLEGEGYRLVRTDGTVPAGGPGEVASGGDGWMNDSGDFATGRETTLPETTLPETTVPPTTVPPTTVPPTAVPVTAAIAAGGPVTCAFTVTQAWGPGGNGELTIENAGNQKLTAWTVRIASGGDRISLWNADTVSSSRGSLTAKNQRWNGTIAAGSAATPTGGSIQGGRLEVGKAYPCEIITPKPDLDDLGCDLDVTQTWPDGGSVRLAVENDGTVDVSSWTVEVELEAMTVTSWSGVEVVKRHGNHLTLTSQDWTSFIGAGQEQRSVTGQVSGKLGTKQSFDCEVVAAG